MLLPTGYILNMLSPQPNLVNTEAKLVIIQIRIVNPARGYEQTFEG